MSDEAREAVTARRAVEEAKIAAVIDRAFYLPGESHNLSFRAVQAARNLLSSGLVVPAAIHKVATDALEAGDACGAVGCRALIERDAALAELAQVTQWHDEVRQECAELRGALAGIGDVTNEGDQG